MKNLVKRALYFAAVFSLALILVGCFGLGNIKRDRENRDAIADRLNAFGRAVEIYDVEGMLAFLNEEGFVLTIVEGGNPAYEKSYAVLEEELREDEEKQLRWRKPVEQGGQGYILTMEFGTLTYSNMTATGAVVVADFTILEDTDEIEQIITDRGSIICEMVQLEQTWYCQKMTIHFESVSSSLMNAEQKYLKGFGFGQ